MPFLLHRDPDDLLTLHRFSPPFFLEQLFRRFLSLPGVAAGEVFCWLCFSLSKQ